MVESTSLTALTTRVLRPTQSALRRLERQIEAGVIHPSADHVQHVVRSAKAFTDALERALTSTH